MTPSTRRSFTQALFGAAMIVPSLALADKPAKKKGKDSHAAEGKEITLTGEVIDIACYAQHPDTGQGPDHAECARQCINRGLPAGLLADGKLYLLMKPGHDPLVDEVAPLAGKMVNATGIVIDSAGLPVFVFKSIKKRG